MKLRRLRRLAAKLAIAWIGLGLCCGEDRSPAVYIEGTLDGIAAQSSGAMEFGDQERLILKFGDFQDAIPYGDIISARWSRARSSNWMSHIAAPFTRWFGKSKFLTLEFRDGMGRAVFRMTPAAAAAASPILAARTGRGTEDSGVAAGTPEQDSWWGDRYWKTSRNKHRWPTAAGAKR